MVNRIEGIIVGFVGVLDQSARLAPKNPASPEGERSLPVASATGIMPKYHQAQRATHPSSKRRRDNHGINVSPSGLEEQHNQCPVADATGSDVPPSGLNLIQQTPVTSPGQVASLRQRVGPECTISPKTSCQPGGRKIPAGGVSHRNHAKISPSPEGDTSVIKKET